MENVARFRSGMSFFPFLLLLSGFAGISYELLYARLLGNSIGDQWVVSAAILLTFLLGIGIGTRFAFLLWRHLWLIEAGIGLYAMGFALGINIIESWLYSSQAVFGTGFGFSLLQCVILLIPVTFLIGCSLPLFAGYLGRLSEGLAFARAYTWHSFGAALTILLVEFWLIRQFGLQVTVLIIAALNISVGLLLRFGFAELREEAPQKLSFIRLPRHHLIALATLSIASAIFQLWLVKMAEFVLGPFRESFALVLALVLLGIAIGTWLVKRFRLGFGFVVSANLVGLFWMLAGFGPVTELYASLYPGASNNGFQLVLLKLGLLTMLGGVPALSFGATIPALITSQDNVARESGQLLFISSLANAAGFLLMVFVLHQQFDYGMLIVIIASTSALGLLIYYRGRKVSVVAAMGVMAAVVAAHQGVWNEQLLFLGHHTMHSTASYRKAVRDTNIVSQFKGPQDVFSLNTMADGHTFLHINGYRSMDLNAPNEQMVGAISAQFAPQTDNALVLGVGSGATASTVGLMFDQVDAIEINAVLLDNLDLMSEFNFNITQAGNVNIILDDGIHFTKSSDQQYSLIINTVTTPLYFSSSKLYTRDFLEDIQRRMTPDGVYVTWADNRIGERGMDIVLTTLSKVFDHCALSFINVSYFLLMCSGDELSLQQPGLIAETPRLREYLLSRFGLLHKIVPYSLLTGNAFALIGDHDAPVNTLDYPALEFEMAQLRNDGLMGFYDRLSTNMDIENVKKIAGPGTQWDPMLLAINADRHAKDNVITRTWMSRLEALIPDFEQEFQNQKLEYYALYAEQADNAEAHFAYGYFLYNEGRYQTAVEEFSQVLETESDRPSAHFYIGSSHDFLGNPDQSLEYFARELALFPDNMRALMGSAVVHLDRRETGPALEFLNRALAIRPSAQLYYLRGTTLMEMGEHAAAEQALKKALSLSPGNQDIIGALEKNSSGG